jgi:putative hemin transport protein
MSDLHAPAARPAALQDPHALHRAFQQLRHERRLRHRDAARQLGVSECEAVAAAIGQDGPMHVQRLAGPWPGLFEQVPTLGVVMALTRNDSVVHEKVGRYEQMSHEGAMGMALGPDIDLRIFYQRWAHAYAVREDGARGPQHSLQVFDAHGVAIHKVFLREHSDHAAWDAFVERHRHPRQAPGEQVEPATAEETARPDDAIDGEAFREGWAALADTHEFFPLLRRFKLTRTQALRLAPSGFTSAAPTSAARELLFAAAERLLPIMCFVGNPGMIQIHSGPVRRVEGMGQWLNVLDPGFNLHLREDHIAHAWVVRKPTRDGMVTSLELFDAEGRTIALFFGERKPGKAELPAWRTLVESLAGAAA